MPEIKNTFLKGKMNKDLDERLVPNGEYVDAVNIQVATSEDSEVGTAQNILGNYLIPGQTYFARNNNGHYQKVHIDSDYDGYQCVGAISDEPNDRLFFFVTYAKAITITNASFARNLDNWTESVLSSSISTNPWSHDYTLGAVAEVGEDGYIEADVTGVSDGSLYQLYYDITKVSEDGELLLANHTTNGDNVLVNGYNTNRVGRFSTTWEQGASNVNKIKIYNTSGYIGAIKNLELYEVKSSKIIEYNTVTKEITPIFIDKLNDVLNFQPNNIITGINIIDDLLFWTDNYGEPKKINIERSKKGTNFKANNFEHTQLVKDTLANGLNQGQITSIEERHITVIKPSPRSSLNIDKVLNDDGANGNLNEALFRITSQNENAIENFSSLRTSNNHYNNTGTNLMTDFSGRFGEPGFSFWIYPETDLNGDSGFTLNYKAGDILLLKAYDYSILEGGGYSLTQPSTPLLDYDLKVKIKSTAVSVSDFTDLPTELNQNPDFTISSGSSHAPAGYLLSSGADQYIEYDSNISVINIDAPANTGYHKFATNILTGSISSSAGNTYRITVKISNYVSGKLDVFLVTSQTGANPDYFRMATGYGDIIEANGEYVYLVESGGPIGNSSNYNYYSSRAFLQVANNHGFEGTVESFNVEDISTELDPDTPGTGAKFPVEIVARKGTPPTVPPGFTELTYVMSKEITAKKPFELKFPRFSYRWKYADGEYSTIAPFTGVVFEPGSFAYHPTKGYNLGMINNVISIEISNWRSHCPEDVIEAEILYKDETSPNIYIVDTLTQSNTTSGAVSSFYQNFYSVSMETLKAALPSDQLLRPWDAVPKKALAQEISGNRIIYGNYYQGYNLDKLNNVFGVNEYTPDLNFSIASKNINFETVQSVKSLREYQLGVVFVDKYGRETPVLSNSIIYDALEKENAQRQNKLRVSFDNEHYPENMEFMKFFIKENSGEYYNLAMDRWYNAGDENVWISFPSSERNKIDIDTYLILKKGVETQNQVVKKARYKVLAIENEPPGDIKFKKIKIESLLHDLTSNSVNNDLFVADMEDAPLSLTSDFKLRYKPFYDGTASNLQDETSELYIDFEDEVEGTLSKRYKVSKVTSNYDGQLGASGNVDSAVYSFQMQDPFEDDVDFILIDDKTEIRNSIRVNIYKYDVKENNEFAGRFFVKINNDNIFYTEIIDKTVEQVNYRVAKSRKVYFMNGNGHNFNHNGFWTGQNDGVYANNATYVKIEKKGSANQGRPDYTEDSTNINTYFPWTTGEGWNNIGGATGGSTTSAGYLDETRNNHFGRFAPFFRRYSYSQDSASLYETPSLANAGNAFLTTHSKNTTTEINVGQYKFGEDTNNWAFELAYITTPMNSLVQGFHIDGSGDAQYHVGGTNGSGISADFVTHGVDNINKIKYADDQWTGNLKKRNEGDFDAFGKQRKGDVWFIDKGKFEGRRSDASIHWSYLQPNVGQMSGISQSSGIMHLAIGGVYHDKVATYSSNSESEYFKVGFTASDGETNPDYDHPSTRNLVRKFYPGSKFRWKEDPNKEVYTVRYGIENKRLLRAMASEWPYIKDWGTGHENFPGADTALGGGGGGNIETGRYHGDLTHAAAQLSANITRGWGLYYENSSGNKTMDWDPTNNGTPGPIPNGLELQFTPPSGATVNVTSQPQIIIRTKDISCVDPIFGNKEITEGMILTSYNNGGTILNNSPNDGSDQELLVDKVENLRPASDYFKITLVGYRRLLTPNDLANPGNYYGTSTEIKAHKAFSASTINMTQQMVFKQAAMNGYSQYSVDRINAQNVTGEGHSVTTPGVGAVGYTIEFLEDVDDSEGTLPDNPAMWETEPKEQTVDIDLFYEASGCIPFKLNLDNYTLVLQQGSKIEHVGNQSTISDAINYIGFGYEYTPQTESPGNKIGYYITLGTKTAIPLGGFPRASLTNTNVINIDDRLRITSSTGYAIELTVLGWFDGEVNSSTGTVSNDKFRKFFVSPKIYSPDTVHELGWFNCYSFGNGVESDRIRDSFNLATISNGAKVSTTFDPYREEQRKYGLIFSGIYNSNTGSNNLNQFIAANKITKDINPIYGSIQKLHSRDTDLITLCEDKILRILANKDAVFNADGNPQLTANQNVLGQAVPFVGEFGISKNPESFASESYRVYFADKQRGAIIRLSRDGLTPISDHGMKDWFRDNLKLNNTIIGSYDDRNDEYNVSLKETQQTVSFREDVKGWVSFKSFTPEHAISCVNEYYSFNNGKIYHHYNEHSLRNTFYLDYVVVESIGPHPDQNNLGHYGWFSAESIINKYSAGPGNPGNGSPLQTFNGSSASGNDWIIPVKQYRKGELIYDGVIVVFGANDVNHLVGEKGERLAHCRRNPIMLKPNMNDRPVTPEDYGRNTAGPNPSAEPVTSPNHWEVGDVIIFSNVSTDSVDTINTDNIENRFEESSINLLLNQDPGAVKTFHTLDYEGSQAKTTGLRNVKVDSVVHHQPALNIPDGEQFYIREEDQSVFLNMIQPDSGVPGASGYVRSVLNVKQYRVPNYTGGYLGGQTLGPVLIREGLIRYYSSDPVPRGTWDDNINADDWKPGDIITTELEEKSVNVFDYIEKHGWYVEDIKTNKQEGSLVEFLNKEGKWFNNIKGKNHDTISDIDLKSANVQGVGIISDYSYESGYLPNNQNKIQISFKNSINKSLQVGDKLYSERTTSTLGPEILPPLETGNYIGNKTEISYGTNSDGTPNMTIETTQNSLGSPVYLHPSINSLNFDLKHTKIYHLNIVFDNFDNNTTSVSNPYTAADRFYIYGTGYVPTWTPNAAPFGLKPILEQSIFKQFTFNKNNNNGSLENVFRLELKPNSSASGFNDTYKQVTIKSISLKELIPGNSFGMTQIKTDELFYLGTVLSFTDKTITLATDETSASTWLNDYVMFVKPEVINTSSLIGYFADINIKNNSLVKAELFSVASEVTESSR